MSSSPSNGGGDDGAAGGGGGGGGGGPPAAAPPISGRLEGGSSLSSVVTSLELASRALVELELFHDCGCPRVRECVCYIYIEGCGRCSECLKNRLSAKETGSKGSRICKLAQANADEVMIGKFKLEYPRHLIQIPPEKARLMGHNVRQLRFIRKVFDFSLQQLLHERKMVEREQANRCRVVMLLEDEVELLQTRALTSAYIDTDLVHGYWSRVRKDAVGPIVLPLLQKDAQALKRVREIHEAIMKHWAPFAAYHITRVGKGFAGRMASRNRRRAFLRHFAVLRIQAAWRGFFDRARVVPKLRFELEKRSATIIQRCYRRFRDTRTFKWRARAKLWRLKSRAATRFAALFRGHMTRKYLAAARARASNEKAGFEARMAGVMGAARLRREAIKTRAATTLQRLWRGVLGRRTVYARRNAGLVNNPRVRELTDKFLASGDLWGFIAAVNADYNVAEKDKVREVTRARAFVDQVIRVRAEKGEKAWRQWQEFKAKSFKRGGLGEVGDRPPSRLASVLGGAEYGGSRPATAADGATDSRPHTAAGEEALGSRPGTRGGERSPRTVLDLANDGRPGSRAEARERELRAAYSPQSLRPATPGEQRPGSRGRTPEGSARPALHGRAAPAPAPPPAPAPARARNTRSSAYPPEMDEASFKLGGLKNMYLGGGGLHAGLSGVAGEANVVSTGGDADGVVAPFDDGLGRGAAPRGAPHPDDMYAPTRAEGGDRARAARREGLLAAGKLTTNALGTGERLGLPHVGGVHVQYSDGSLDSVVARAAGRAPAASAASLLGYTDAPAAMPGALPPAAAGSRRDAYVRGTPVRSEEPLAVLVHGAVGAAVAEQARAAGGLPTVGAAVWGGAEGAATAPAPPLFGLTQEESEAVFAHEGAAASGRARGGANVITSGGGGGALPFLSSPASPSARPPARAPFPPVGVGAGEGGGGALPAAGALVPPVYPLPPASLGPAPHATHAGPGPLLATVSPLASRGVAAIAIASEDDRLEEGRAIIGAVLAGADADVALSMGVRMLRGSPAGVVVAGASKAAERAAAVGVAALAAATATPAEFAATGGGRAAGRAPARGPHAVATAATSAHGLFADMAPEALIHHPVDGSSAMDGLLPPAFIASVEASVLERQAELTLGQPAGPVAAEAAAVGDPAVSLRALRGQLAALAADPSAVRAQTAPRAPLPPPRKAERLPDDVLRTASAIGRARAAESAAARAAAREAAEDTEWAVATAHAVPIPTLGDGRSLPRFAAILLGESGGEGGGAPSGGGGDGGGASSAAALADGALAPSEEEAARAASAAVDAVSASIRGRRFLPPFSPLVDREALAVHARLRGGEGYSGGGKKEEEGEEGGGGGGFPRGARPPQPPTYLAMPPPGVAYGAEGGLRFKRSAGALGGGGGEAGWAAAAREGVLTRPVAGVLREAGPAAAALLSAPGAMPPRVVLTARVMEEALRSQLPRLVFEVARRTTSNEIVQGGKSGWGKWSKANSLGVAANARRDADPEFLAREPFSFRTVDSKAIVPARDKYLEWQDAPRRHSLPSLDTSDLRAAILAEGTRATGRTPLPASETTLAGLRRRDWRGVPERPPGYGDPDYDAAAAAAPGAGAPGAREWRNSVPHEAAGDDSMPVPVFGAAEGGALPAASGVFQAGKRPDEKGILWSGDSGAVAAKLGHAAGRTESRKAERAASQAAPIWRAHTGDTPVASRASTAEGGGARAASGGGNRGGRAASGFREGGARGGAAAVRVSDVAAALAPGLSKRRTGKMGTRSLSPPPMRARLLGAEAPVSAYAASLRASGTFIQKRRAFLRTFLVPKPEMRSEDEVRRLLDLNRGFGSIAVLDAADPSVSARRVEYPPPPEPPAGFDNLGRPLKRLLSDAERVELGKVLTRQEERQHEMPSLFAAPYDDGWRDEEERAEAAARIKWLRSLSEPLQAAAAHTMATSLVAAMMDAVSGFVQSVAVGARKAARQATLDAAQRAALGGRTAALKAAQAALAPAVLLDGAARRKAFISHLNDASSIALLEDVYRMSALRPDMRDKLMAEVLAERAEAEASAEAEVGAAAAAEAAAAAAAAPPAPASEPASSIVGLAAESARLRGGSAREHPGAISTMEALQARVDPAMSRGATKSSRARLQVGAAATGRAAAAPSPLGGAPPSPAAASAAAYASGGGASVARISRAASSQQQQPDGYHFSPAPPSPAPPTGGLSAPASLDCTDAGGGVSATGSLADGEGFALYPPGAAGGGALGGGEQPPGAFRGPYVALSAATHAGAAPRPRSPGYAAAHDLPPPAAFSPLPGASHGDALLRAAALTGEGFLPTTAGPDPLRGVAAIRSAIEASSAASAAAHEARLAAAVAASGSALGMPAGGLHGGAVTRAQRYGETSAGAAPLESLLPVFEAEAVLQANAMAVPSVRALMVDVRGIDGPFDLLVYHAVLRILPMPMAAVLEAREQGIVNTDEFAQLTRLSKLGEGSAASASDAAAAPGRGDRSGLFSQIDTHDQMGRRIPRKAGAALAPAAAAMGASGAGELAARVLRDMAPSMARIAWEKALHEAAYPVVAVVRSRQVRFVADLLKINLETLPVAPAVIASMKRLLAVLISAARLAQPSSVKALFEAGAAKTKQESRKAAAAAAAAAGASASTSAAFAAAQAGAIPPHKPAGSIVPSPAVYAYGHSGEAAHTRSPAQPRPGAPPLPQAGTGGGFRGVGTGDSFSSSIMASEAHPASGLPSASPSVAAAPAAAAAAAPPPPLGAPSPTSLLSKTGRVPGLSGDSAVSSMRHAAGRVLRAGARGIIDADAAAAGNFRAGMGLAAGDAGLGSPRGVSHIVSPLPGKDAQWQPGLLSKGPGALAAAGFMAPADARARAAASLAALSGGGGGGGGGGVDGSGDDGDGGPPPQAVFFREGLFLPFGAYSGLEPTVARAAPQSLTLPPGFSILPEEDGAGPAGASWLAERMVDREDAAVSAAREEAAQALTALTPGLRGSRGSAGEKARAAAGAVAEAAGARGAKDASYLEQKAALTSLIRSATDPSVPPRATRVEGLARALLGRTRIVSGALSSGLDGMGGLRDLESSLDLAMIQALFLLPLPSPLCVAMAEARAGLPPRDAIARTATLVPFQSFVGALLLCHPIAPLLHTGLRSYARAGDKGGVHGNEVWPAAPPGQFQAFDKGAEFGGLEDFAAVSAALIVGAAQSSSARAAVGGAAGAEAAAAAAGAEAGSDDAPPPPPPPASSAYGARKIVKPAVPDAALPAAVAAALAALPRGSKAKQLIHERATAAAAAAAPYVAALKRWGFTRMAHIIRLPPSDLLPVFASAQPPAHAVGAVYLEKCAVAVGGTVPPLGLALMLQSVTEQWLKARPEMLAEASKRSGAYDSRFVRGPTDPRRVGGRVSEAEQSYAAGLKAVRALDLGSLRGAAAEMASMSPALAHGFAAERGRDGGRVKLGMPGVRMSVATSLARDASAAAHRVALLAEEAARVDDERWEAVGGAPAALVAPPAAAGAMHPGAALLRSGLVEALEGDAAARAAEMAHWTAVAEAARAGATREQQMASNAWAAAPAPATPSAPTAAAAAAARVGFAGGGFVIRDGKRPQQP